MPINTSGEVLKGSIKTFIGNFQKGIGIVNNQWIITPNTGKGLRLKFIRGVFSKNNEDVATVFEILAGDNIIKQLYYADWNDLLAQMDSVSVVDSLFHFKKIYEQSPDMVAMDLLSSAGMQLKIYFTTEAIHTGTFTSYTPKVLPLSKKDATSAIEPVASVTIECVSFDE